MKIKCPLCEFETVDRDNITFHIENKHNLTLDVLIFKIHEKISQYQDMINGCMEGEIPLNEVNVLVIKELKSLLENER